MRVGHVTVNTHNFFFWPNNNKYFRAGDWEVPTQWNNIGPSID